MRKFIAFASACVLLTACAVTPFRTPISQSFIDSKEPVFVYLVFDQEELDAEVPIQDSSAATSQYGLIGAVVGGAIDASVNKSNSELAEENLAPIRNALIGYDFNQLFEKSAHESLNNLENLNVAEVVRLNSLKEFNELEKTLPSEQKSLILKVQYKLGPNFRVAYAKLDAMLTDKSIEDKKLQTLYRNRFTAYGEMQPFPTISQEEIDEKVSKVKSEFFAMSKTEQKSKKNRQQYFKDLKKAEKKALSRAESIERLSAVWVEESQELATSLQDRATEIFSLLGTDMMDINSAEYYQTMADSLNQHPANFKSTLVYETDNRLAIRSALGYNSGKICAYEKVESGAYALCF